MAKFNTGSTEKTKIVNRAGGEGYIPTPKEKLLNMASTCLFNEPKYYGEVEKDILNAIDEVASKDPKFILQLASYLRKEMYLRTTPVVLLTTAANTSKCKQFVRQYAPKVLQRADELNEAVACQLEMFGKPIPNSLKKGIRDTFTKFDEYQFAKYNRQGATVKFRDTIMLTHPKEPGELLKKILEDALEVPYTWETELSEKGNKPEVWEALISSGKLPYMATLRNLRNILTTGDKGVADEHISRVIKYISDPEQVARSKQFPFRFFNAYRELEHINHPRTAEVLDALDAACAHSYSNIPKMLGTTLIAGDTSGSMTGTISRNSSIDHREIALILGSALHKYTDRGVVGCFAERWATFTIPKMSSGIIANVEKLKKHAYLLGGSTNGHLAISWMLEQKDLVFDRVIFITDCQLWNDSGFWSGDNRSLRGEMQKYWQVNQNCMVYIINVNGYGEVNFPEGTQNVVYINGWSDKILKFIEVHEKDPHAQVKYIEQNY